MTKMLPVALLVLAFLAGCGTTPWKIGRKDPPPPPSRELPTATALTAYLNDNGGRIQSVNVGMLELDCAQDGKSFGLRGKLVAQKGRNLRLTGGAVAGQELDLGSNEQEFWFWVKRGQGIKKDEPSPQFYCSYRDLIEGKVKVMPVPFQPDWIMETLGLGPYGPPEKYTVERGPDGRTIRMTEKTTTPQGRAVHKVIVFNASPVAAPQPQVQQFLLLDAASGKEICAATIMDVQVDKKTGGVIPRRIELRYPDEKVTLKLRLDDTTVNGIVPATAFVRRPLDGVRSYNLAELHLDSALR
jgi:hypothetical protein